MPGPGRGGGGGRGGHFGGGGGRGHVGGGHRGHGWGGRAHGHGWGPRPFWRPFGPPVRGLGVVGAVATGAVIAATLPPRRRRYPVPRPGYIYVVEGGTPRAMPVQEAPFIVRRIGIPSVAQGTQGEVVYHVQVTINDGYTYVVARRYSQFDELRVRVMPLIRSVTPPFPPKRGIRSTFVGLGSEGIEERRSMLMAWLQSLITAATTGSPGLRLPLYDFLQTTTFYPPEPEDAQGDASSTSATAAASPTAPLNTHGIPIATATPLAETMGGTSAFPPAVPVDAAAKKIGHKDAAGGDDGWGVPVPSRENSDMKMAMAGPDGQGKLAAAAAAEALRAGTGASTDDLRAVWELSDIDKDGKLDRDEFALAWYLAEKAAAGGKPPTVLPPDLVPPSKRSGVPTTSTNPF